MNKKQGGLMFFLAEKPDQQYLKRIRSIHMVAL